jgi:hypothetical protein
MDNQYGVYTNPARTEQQICPIDEQQEHLTQLLFKGTKTKCLAFTGASAIEPDAAQVAFVAEDAPAFVPAEETPANPDHGSDGGEDGQ